MKQEFTPNKGKPAFSRKESGMNSILWCGNHAGNPGEHIRLDASKPANYDEFHIGEHMTLDSETLRRAMRAWTTGRDRRHRNPRGTTLRHDRQLVHVHFAGAAVDLGDIKAVDSHP
ncbi:MAG: hypothetical protein M0C28_44115 [Candidatus Moduliflexus flocculans]|nr:hypothetical protein [Candidatus Moduliflexus flocculans]